MCPETTMELIQASLNGKIAHGQFPRKPWKFGNGRGTVGKCAGPKWSKMVQTTILVKMAVFRTGFRYSRHQKILVHFGPFWPKEVYFGPFRSANRTLATPEKLHHQNCANKVLSHKCVNYPFTSYPKHY